jgi:hypothetical protein
MVRWIGGPHAAEHCVNGETFARPKETCIEENFNELVQVFTKGSPTCINAECSQENHHACRERSNHSVIDDNQAMVTKTLLKEMNQGRLLMLHLLKMLVGRRMSLLEVRQQRGGLFNQPFWTGTRGKGWDGK